MSYKGRENFFPPLFYVVITVMKLLKPLILAILFLSLLFFQKKIDLVYKPQTTFVTARLLQGLIPEKPVFLGYEVLVADLFWLKALQIIGEKKIGEKQYLDLFDILDLTTTLDPKFEAVYKYGGPFLSIVGNLPKKSQALLYKGHKALPNDGQILFYIAFNDYIYFQDYLSAAKNMEQAAALSNAPPLTAMLASRLYVEAGNPAMAITFLVHMIQTTKDEDVRKALLKRIEEIEGGQVKGIFRSPLLEVRPHEHH